MPLNPPYQLQPLSEDDIDAYMVCASSAFLDDPLRKATFPPHLVDPADPGEEQRFRETRMRKRLAEQSGGRAFKIEDPARPGVIAACSSWIAPQKPGPDGAGDAAEKRVGRDVAVDRPKCANPVVWDEQVRLLNLSKENIFGKSTDFWYLAGLATHPDYQGNGLGAALVRWGLEQAEKDGLPVYLEATPAGAPLYKRLGFEVVEEHDLSRFITDGTEYKVLSMLKRPGGKA
ncbi:hypothetical protein MPH_09620 [Macrophomina phaseolina MS6]|uniref:N-acetyltransferase domain-containing protein n=2 Tax=Macrophomina phaseolina TaxID=35725 RepID=K2RFD9_MACPH|nr:hypothetical protein MPH_09620 [Macrophomina phaseolina MS6]KAH7036821.1 acyl-CoA N-acyltransferase [Macrophomina phaseolina]